MTFGPYFRILRKRYGWSQARLAERAEISVRAIIYWESDTYQPRLDELQAALTALGATEAEKMQAMSLMTAARGVRGAQEKAREISPDYLGDLPSLGEFLQTLRKRSGQTSAQTAQAIGIHATTLRRWERMDWQPSAEDMTRLCAALGAAPDEADFLMQHRAGMPTGNAAPDTLESLEQNAEAFHHAIQTRPTASLDLWALHLRQRCWPLAVRLPQAERLLARTDSDYALWLTHQSRFQEANRIARRALDTAAAHGRPEPFWANAVYVTALCAKEKPTGTYEQGLRLYRPWLTKFSHGPTRMVLLNNMANCASKAGLHTQAVTLIEEAERIAQQSGLQSEYETSRTIKSGIFSRMGRHDMALCLLPALPESGFTPRALYLYYWSETLLRAGERNASESHLAQLYAAGREVGSSLVIARADALAQLL